MSDGERYIRARGRERELCREMMDAVLDFWVSKAWYEAVGPEKGILTSSSSASLRSLYVGRAAAVVEAKR